MMQWLMLIVGVFLVFFANAVILINHPVKSVLSLVACFLCVSVYWLLLDAEYLALVLIFLYIGAVMTLFLFMVMMMNVSEYAKNDQFSWLFKFLVLITTVVVPITGVLLMFSSYQGTSLDLDYALFNETVPTGAYLEYFSQVLYHEYYWLLQLLAMILVVPIVVSAGIVRQGTNKLSKQQSAQEQLATSTEARLSLVNNKKGR